jgi:hypothetical protein
VSNITEVSKPTQWKPGQSDNLHGRPVGTRQAFSAGFLRDLAEVWSEEGRETLVKTAKTSPAVFSGVQLVEQGLSFLQIKRVEAFSEPAVDRSKQFASLLRLPLIAPPRLEVLSSVEFNKLCDSCGSRHWRFFADVESRKWWMIWLNTPDPAKGYAGDWVMRSIGRRGVPAF